MSKGVTGLALIALTALVASCGSPPQPEGATGTAAPPGIGGVTGRIAFMGTAPDPRVIRMDSDPLCLREGQAVYSEVLIVGPSNGLQNAFVYVKDGLGDWTFPVPTTPVVLDQEGCRYMPHVFGVRAGQPVEIVNSDPTFHNVNARPKINREFNFGQHKQGERTTRTFDLPEVMIPFRCDVHGWMNAYAGVLPHPFFSVSRADGSYEITGLPAGTYTIEVWHEQLGTQIQTVTISEDSTNPQLDFTFTEVP
jgi:plastocyanin